MKDFTREELMKIRDDIEALGAKYGCKFDVGNISFNEVEAKISIQAVKLGDENESTEQRLFNQYCRNFNLTPSDYRKTVFVSGKIFKLVGFNPKARKNFYIIENEKGVRYVCGGFDNE